MFAAGLIGRDAEITSLYDFLDRATHGQAAFVLEGEPGIGKSTLLQAGVEHGRLLGCGVLSARPTEAEHDLAHAALGDLFEDELDEVVNRLSAPRRRAFEGALLLVDEPSGPVEPLALGIAVRDVLQLLAEQRRQLIAIDDLQWLDSASANALAFAVRRLGESPVTLLLARRSEGAQGSQLEQALPYDAHRLSLGPLSVGALHALLRYRTDGVFARQTLLRIHEHSGGNPFYALEIARVLGTSIDPSEPLPVPQSLDELVHRRISTLPPPTRSALAFVAALGSPSETVLRRAGVTPEALAPAVAEDVISIVAGQVTFTHPLLASAVSDASVHRHLATIVDDPAARARHLAKATEAPNAKVACALDDGARLALERGATALAAELNEQALRLTPQIDAKDRHRRALAAARAHQAAGEWTRAQAIARSLLVETDPGPRRAEVLVLLAELEVDELAVPLLEEALIEAETQPHLHLRIYINLSVSRRFMTGFAAAFADTRDGIAKAEKLDDDALLVVTLSNAAFLGRVVAPSEALGYAWRARKVAVRCGDTESIKLSAGVLGQVLVDCGEYEAARGVLESDYEHWRERDERFAAGALWTLAWLDLWTGNFERATERAARSHEISIQYGLEWHGSPIPGAWAAAYCGHLDRARQLADHGLALFRGQVRVDLFPGVLGLIAALSGDVESAVEHFAEADDLALALDIRNPHMRPWTPDYIEALLALGKIDDARRVLDVWEADAIGLERTRIFAPAMRCRGLIAAAERCVDEAGSLLTQAIQEHAQIDDSFGRGRALLALGLVQRRQRKKLTARNALEEAQSVFLRLGALIWAERAKAELGKVGGRTREVGLTGAEHRVAALVADGRTNRETAAKLCLSERTVEAHLSHTYAKLGVRSRAELVKAYRSRFEGATEQSRGKPTIPS